RALPQVADSVLDWRACRMDACVHFVGLGRTIDGPDTNRLKFLRKFFRQCPYDDAVLGVRGACDVSMPLCRSGLRTSLRAVAGGGRAAGGFPGFWGGRRGLNLQRSRGDPGPNPPPVAHTRDAPAPPPPPRRAHAPPRESLS